MQSILTTCKNCGHQFNGKYCNSCGEKVYTEHDRKVSHFFEEGLHFITHFEGKFFTTIKTIFTRPGKLSTDYCHGIRKSYFKPLSLFLLLVVIYLLFPVFEGLNMRLQFHEEHNYYGAFATAKVQALLQKTHMNKEQLTEAFHQKSEKVSKFLMIVILPLTALFFWLFTFKKRKYFFDQMVFSAEVNSFFLMWGYLVLPLLIMVPEGISRLITGHYFAFSDSVSGILVYGLSCIYVGIASRRFYQLRTWQSVLFGLAFFVVHFIVVHIVYKFLLFVLVINQIH